MITLDHHQAQYWLQNRLDIYHAFFIINDFEYTYADQIRSFKMATNMIFKTFAQYILWKLDYYGLADLRLQSAPLVKYGHSTPLFL